MNLKQNKYKRILNKQSSQHITIILFLLNFYPGDSEFLERKG